MKAAPERVRDKTLEPDLLLGSHLAALDFAFYTGNQFPGDFRNGVFVALHGSWNRSTRDGYVIRFVPMKIGEAPGEGYDFVAGWTDSGDDKSVLGRPSGLLQTQDGRLLIADDGTGRIWQVRYRGESTPGASSRQE
jgi:glucose/arabinose dehydrogenase